MVDVCPTARRERTWLAWSRNVRRSSRAVLAAHQSMCVRRMRTTSAKTRTMREPEIADDEGEVVVAELEEAPPTEPSELAVRVMNRFLVLRLVYRTPLRRDLTTCDHVHTFFTHRFVSARSRRANFVDP